MDTATRTLDSIKNGVATGAYVPVENVVFFDAHDEFDQRRYVRNPKDQEKLIPNPDFGKLIRRFDRERLQRIVDINKNRAASSGDIPPVGPGHTIPGHDVPETQQPPIWGYATVDRVDTYGPSNSKLGIIGTIYARAEHAEAVKKEFPRRSIELVPGEDGFIDWVALLRRSPQRDLGLLAYSREAQVLGKKRFCPWEASDFRITADPGGNRQLAACYSADGKLRYSLDNEESNMAAPNIGAPPPVPGTPAPAMDLPPEEQTRADSYWRYYRTKYAAEFPSANNIPPVATTGDAPVGPPPKKCDDDEAMRMQRDSEAIRYARQEERIKVLEAERDAERYARTQAECERVCAQLEGEGFELDRAHEVKRMSAMSEADRAAHVEGIKRYYRQAPVGSFMIPTGPANTGGNDDRYGEGGSPELHRAAMRYMREHPGIDYNDARESVAKRRSA